MSEKNITKVKKILVVGLGLIGASLCRDLKKKSKYEKIYGYDQDVDIMQFALDNNFVHDIKKDLNEGIANSDLIVLCVPVYLIYPGNVGNQLSYISVCGPGCGMEI